MDLKMLVLSSLLHDIGKFAQRANRPYTKELQGENLPVYNGKYSHWHALYSDYFIENDLPLPDELENLRSRIARTASIHHRPVEDNLEEMCVSIADRLSSGADRLENKEDESKTGFRESRLISIFDEIELKNHKFEPPGQYFYRLAALDTKDDTVFPVKDAVSGPAEEYQALFDKFYMELAKVNIRNGFTLYLENLISLLEQFTWAIPSSSYKTLSDIPLFDHSISTAGIAQALFLYHKSTDTIPAFKNNAEEKFILLTGDLSGIQKYIFGINHSTSRGISKIFRARSFFIQTIVQSIILEIEDRLKIYSVCRLMNSGGKFMLLLPNTIAVNQELEKIDYEVQIWFRQKFKGLLTFPMSWDTCMAQGDFKKDKFKIKIEEANDALNAAKLQKLNKTFKSCGNIIDHDYEEFEGGNCSLCEINTADDKASETYRSEEGNELPICRDCLEQITYIGTRLSNAEYLVYGRRGKIPLFGKIYLSIPVKEQFDFNTCLRIETLTNAPGYCRARIAKHLPSISKKELKDEALFALFEKEEGFHDMIRHLEDNSEARISKTFNMIADKSRKKINGSLTGRPLLGFLKADVDNLGLIFSTGLGKNSSIARIASLSRMLNFFFTDYIVSLLEKGFPDIYVVFSGGDDLFLIGPWNQIVEFSLVMRKKLSKFCAMNPDITLSCGILNSKPRLPVRKAVQLAEESLEKAKAFESDSEAGKRVKDSVCFLETPVSWEKFEELIELGKKFDKAMEEQNRTNFSNAFLYRLLTYHKMYLNFTGKGRSSEYDIKSGRYLSHAYYDIARNIRRDNDKNKNDKNKDELSMLYEIFSIGTNNRDMIEYLDIPIFYAMNLNRKF